MQDKVAIVTGASRGIGYAIAKELAGLGYSLGLTARTETEIQEVAGWIMKQYPGVKVVACAFDVADGRKTKDFVKKINSELGIVSVLVNNAGVYVTGTSELPQEEIKRMMDVNFFAAAEFSKAVIPGMKKRGEGYIFNIASVCGVQGFSDTGGYSASKFALVGYSSSLTQELAPMGIKVTAICPSWVNTEKSVNAPLKPEEMIQTADIAETVRYLLSLGPTASIREIVIHCK